MVYLETEEANAAIQSLIETTRYIAKKYELKKQTNIDSQEEIHTNRAKEIEKKATNWSQTSMNTQPKQLNQQMDQKKIKTKELTIQ